MICAILANVNRNPKKHPRAYKVEDFMPGKRQSTQDMMTITEAITTAFGGEDRRGHAEVRQKHMPEQLKRVLERVNG